MPLPLAPPVVGGRSGTQHRDILPVVDTAVREQRGHLRLPMAIDFRAMERATETMQSMNFNNESTKSSNYQTGKH